MTPRANRIRVVVHVRGLNPVDWALCRRLHERRCQTLRLDAILRRRHGAAKERRRWAHWSLDSAVLEPWDGAGFELRERCARRHGWSGAGTVQ